MNTSMTKDEIVLENVRFYLSDTSRFSAEGGACYYEIRDEKGNEKNCAIGRCMSERGKERYGSFRGDVRNLIEDIQETRPVTDQQAIDFILEPRYHGHGKDFWRMMQKWHDTVCDRMCKNEVSRVILNEMVKKGFIRGETADVLFNEFPPERE